VGEVCALPSYLQQFRAWYDRNFTVKGFLSFLVLLYCAIPDWLSRNEFWSNKVHSIAAWLQTEYGRLAVIVLAGVVIWLDHRTVLKKQHGTGNRQMAGVSGHDLLPSTLPAQVSLPLAKNEQRKFVDVTPEYLIGLFKGNHTTIQSAKLAEAFMGKWIKVSGPTGDVMGDTATLRQLTFSDHSIYKGGQLFMMFYDRKWFDHLSTLKPGDRVTVIGKVGRVNSIELQLNDCEIVDS
jgi:hypothetical protein